MKSLITRTRVACLSTFVFAFLTGCTLTIDPEAVGTQATASVTTDQENSSMSQPQATQTQATQTQTTMLLDSGTMPVGELDMYYEVHGPSDATSDATSEGKIPLLLLHGAFMNIDLNYGGMIPTLAQGRRVIAVEQQGHGRTADVDRPMSFEQMADDTAALLQALGVEQVDIFGYSDGGNVGLGLAIRHPEMVRRLAFAGTNYNIEGLTPENLEFMRNAGVEEMESMRPLYESLAPRPEEFEAVVEKVLTLGAEFPGWMREEMQQIQSPTLVMIGDADIVLPEHAVEMYRLIPTAHLAVLPATDHFMRLQNPEWLLSMLQDFFNAPMPDAE